MAGKAIVGVEEMAGKLKAALDARQGDTMIMARTDAIATDGFQEAMDRMALYREIGADILFVEAPTDLDQLRRVPKELDGPCMVNQIDGGATPILSAAEAQDMGYAASAMPVTATHAVMKALQGFYADLMKNGDLRDAMHHGLGFEAYTDLVGLPQQRATEQAYLDQARAFADGMAR